MSHLLLSPTISVFSYFHLFDHFLFTCLCHLQCPICPQALDTADKVQLEVKYRLPPAGPSPRCRTKVLQVSWPGCSTVTRYTGHAHQGERNLRCGGEGRVPRGGGQVSTLHCRPGETWASVPECWSVNTCRWTGEAQRARRPPSGQEIGSLQSTGRGSVGSSCRSCRWWPGRGGGRSLVLRLCSISRTGRLSSLWSMISPDRYDIARQV